MCSCCCCPHAGNKKLSPKEFNSQQFNFLSLSIQLTIHGKSTKAPTPTKTMAQAFKIEYHENQDPHHSPQQQFLSSVECLTQAIFEAVVNHCFRICENIFNILFCYKTLSLHTSKPLHSIKIPQFTLVYTSKMGS